MKEDLEQKPRLRPIDILEAMKTPAPVFVGFSPRGPTNEPVEIKRWGQFIVKFGSFKKCGYLATSVNGFFLNGGERCYVLNLGERPEDMEVVKQRFDDGLRVLDRLRDIPFILSPGEFEPEIHDVLLAYCEEGGAYALLDGPEELIENVKEVPEEEAGDDGEGTGLEENEVEKEEEAQADEDEKYVNMPELIGNAGTVIYPWIYLKDRVLGDFYISPTGHIAGILCRLYAENERPKFSDILGTVLLKYKFTSEDIEEYGVRGISFLKYPTKVPGLILE